jgi:hypothetical protein
VNTRLPGTASAVVASWFSTNTFSESAGSTSEPRIATLMPACARSGSTRTDCQGFCVDLSAQDRDEREAGGDDGLHAEAE